MGVFEFVIAIVAIGTCAKLLQQGIAARAAQAERLSSGQYQSLCERLDKVERRMANLETIVLESEKAKAFERSL
jgi:hypothetical protein